MDRCHLILTQGSLALAGLLAVVVLSSPLRAESADPAFARFAWPDSGSVEVDVQRFRSHRRLALRWTLAWRPTPAGLRMEITDTELLAIEAGNQVLDPRSALGHSVRMFDAMIPAWEVDAEGRFLRWFSDDYEARLRRLHADLGSPAPGDSALSAATASLLADPDLQREARARGRTFWRSAVEEWLGLRWEAGWIESDSLGVAYLGEEGRGLLTVQVQELPRIREHEIANVRSALEAMVEDQGRRRTRSQVVEARVERSALRPLQVHVRTSVDIEEEDGPGESIYEETLFDFRWPDLPR